MVDGGCDTQAPMGEFRGGQLGLRVPQDPSNDRSITINKAMNGFIVQVGCKAVVFETREKMLSELDRYLKNPHQVEKEYLERK